MAEGPNCYQVANTYSIEDSEHFEHILKKLVMNNQEINIETVYGALAKELQKFKEKHSKALGDAFKFTPKIMMNLLLNFESFDQTTAERDVFMPEEKLIHFNLGYLKLNFKGKLRLTSERGGGIKAVTEGPAKTYGVVEERDLFIKVDKPISLKYLYIRPKENRIKLNTNDFVIGFNKEIAMFQIKIPISSGRSWIKLTPPINNIIDTIKIPKDYEIDDILITHDSEYAGTPENNDEITSILQGVIEDMIDEQVKKKITEDDL